MVDRMCAVMRWNEEVIKWLAVAVVLAMVGMATMPMAVGELSYGLSAASAIWSASQGDVVGVAFGIAGMHVAILAAAVAPPVTTAAIAVFL